MGSAKDIIVKPISSKDARGIIKRLHYSHKVANNSQLHFGVFINGICGGSLQFGPSLDKRKMIGLVFGTKWNEFIELNRMALADWMPKNSGSRVLAVCMRLIKKNYPFIKWVVSFADGTQCGHGTQYQGAGFYLTGIKKNNQIWKAPSGAKFSRMSLTKGKNILESGGASMKSFANAGFVPLQGYQFRYIYFIDQKAKENLTVPIIPFSDIAKRGAKMYKGISQASVVEKQNTTPSSVEMAVQI